MASTSRLRQEGNVEYIDAIAFLRRRQKIEQERRDSAIVQRSCDLHVARAQTAGAAAMREDYERIGVFGHPQDTRKPGRWNANITSFAPIVLGCSRDDLWWQNA